MQKGTETLGEAAARLLARLERSSRNDPPAVSAGAIQQTLDTDGMGHRLAPPIGGEFTKQTSGRFEIGAAGLFAIGKHAYVDVLTVEFDDSAPRLLWGALPPYAFDPACIVAAERGVGSVLALGRRAEIIDAIITAIPVAMVDVYDREGPVNVEPGKSMGWVAFPFDADISIAVMINAPGFLPGVSETFILFAGPPNKRARAWIVLDHTAQFGGGKCHCLPPHHYPADVPLCRKGPNSAQPKEGRAPSWADAHSPERGEKRPWGKE